MNPFPLEIWHAITTWLGPFDQLRYLETNKSANGSLTRQQRVHLRLWTNIFKDDTWISKVLACGLRPVIFCVDLDAIGNHDTAKTYIILVLTGNVEDIADEMKCSDAFLPSLRSTCFSRENLEVTFKDFTLNVCHILEPGTVIDVPDPTRLFKPESGRIATSVLYYDDAKSSVHTVDLPLATEELVVLDLPPCKGLNLWVVRPRRLQPGLRRQLRGPIGIHQRDRRAGPYQE